MLNTQWLSRDVRLVCLLIALASPAALSGQSYSDVSGSHIIPPQPSYSLHDGDYVFSVQWGFFHAGTSSVQLETAKDGLHVSATADSAGMPDKLYKVHDRFEAAVDPRTFCTLHVSKHNEEGSHRRELNILLDYAHGKSRVDLKDLKTSETKQTEFDIPPCVSDVISGFFYLASLPLAPGYSAVFPVNDNGKTSDVRINVEDREVIKNPAGRFQTLRVRAEPIAGAMKGKGLLWVWFTDDARHAPVQMKSKLAFATFLFQLQKMSPPIGGN